MAGNDAVVGVQVIGGVSQQTSMSFSRFEGHLNNVANAGKNAAAAFRQMSLAGGFAEGALFGSINKFAAFSKTTAEFEERMARASALMGPANANLARMRDTVMTMTGMEHGPNALADAFLELSRAGIENGQALRDMKTVADLATVAQIGLGEAANSTATIMLAWAGPLDTSTKLLSQLANVANATQYSIKGLMAQMRYATPSSLQFGESYRDMLASLGMLAPVVGTVGAGRVHAQMRQVIGNPKALALMSKTLGRNVTGEINSGKILDVLFDVASNLQRKHGIVAGAQKGKEMFSGIGARGMSAYFRVAERGIADADGKILYGKAALEHYRKMADTGSGLGGAEDIRANPGMVMKRLKVDWEKFLIGVGQPFLALLVELEKPLQSILKAGQAFGSSGWAKLGMAISALPLVGAAMGVIRAIGGRTSASLGSLFGIGGAGLGPMNPGTLVPLSSAQRWHTARTGLAPLGYNKDTGLYPYIRSSGYRSPVLGEFFGMAGDTVGRMFPGMQGPSAYFSDPSRNPRTRGIMRRMRVEKTAFANRMTGMTAGVDQLRLFAEDALASGNKAEAIRLNGVIEERQQHMSRLTKYNDRNMIRMAASASSPRGGFSVSNIASYAASSLMNFTSGLLATLGPLALFAGFAAAAADSMSQEQRIKDKQAANRTDLTAFVSGFGTIAEWIKEQTGGGKNWKDTPEMTRLLGQDPRYRDFMSSLFESASEGGIKNITQSSLASAFAQRINAAGPVLQQHAARWGLTPEMQTEVSYNMLKASLGLRGSTGTAEFSTKDLRQTFNNRADIKDSDMLARIMSGKLATFQSSPTGDLFGYGDPSQSMTMAQRLSQARKLKEARDNALANWKRVSQEYDSRDHWSWLPGATDSADISRQAETGERPNAWQAFLGWNVRGAGGNDVYDARRTLMTAEQDYRNMVSKVDPAALARSPVDAITLMGENITTALGKGPDSISDLLKALPQKLAAELRETMMLNAITTAMASGNTDLGAMQLIELLASALKSTSK